MTHEEFLSKIRKGLGRVPKRESRANLSNFMRSKSLHIFLNYTWITDTRFYEWISQTPEVDFYEGQEGLTVFVCDNKGLPVDKF